MEVKLLLGARSPPLAYEWLKIRNIYLTKRLGYQSHPKTCLVKDRENILNTSADTLSEFLLGLNSKNPEIGRTAVLTMYSTFYLRTVDTSQVRSAKPK